MNKDTFFPQYRKLANNLVFYKILDDRNFEEIQLMGTRILKYKFEATKYPEIVKIMEMLDLTNSIYLHASKEEWEDLSTR